MEEGRSAYEILTVKPTGKRYEVMDWFSAGYGLLESLCECDIRPPQPKELFI